MIQCLPSVSNYIDIKIKQSSIKLLQGAKKLAVKSCHSTTRTFLTTCPDLERDRAGENSNFFNLHSKIMETDLDPPPFP